MHKKARRHRPLRSEHGRVRRSLIAGSDSHLLQAGAVFHGLTLGGPSQVPPTTEQHFVLPIRVPEVNTCPVCGYRMAFPADDYNICPCCGTEFGYDDSGTSHADLRAQWVKAGAHWWSPNNPPPPGWDPWVQMRSNLGVATFFSTGFVVRNLGRSPNVPMIAGAIIQQAAQASQNR